MIFYLIRHKPTNLYYSPIDGLGKHGKAYFEEPSLRQIPEIVLDEKDSYINVTKKEFEILVFRAHQVDTI